MPLLWALLLSACVTMAVVAAATLRQRKANAVGTGNHDSAQGDPRRASADASADAATQAYNRLPTDGHNAAQQQEAAAGQEAR